MKMAELELEQNLLHVIHLFKVYMNGRMGLKIIKLMNKHELMGLTWCKDPTWN